MRALIGLYQLIFDGGQREQRLPQSERQPGADLQDRPVVANELGEPLNALVVRGVRLENQMRVIVHHTAQLLGPVALVVDHRSVVELDPWLND